MADVLNQIAAWATIGAFIAATVSLAVIAFQTNHYMSTRRADQRQREFENCHALVDLALGGHGGLYADRQAAAIFELRHYRQYKSFTIRVLSRLLEKCKASDEAELPAVATVIEEINLTLTYLGRK